MTRAKETATPAPHSQSAQPEIVAANYAAVLERLAGAARAADRPVASITLVAVTKTREAAQIRPALQLGHRVFGENRVQEAAKKWPALKTEFPDAQLHLIGPLQTNKAKDAVLLGDAIHTLDRVKLAHALARAMDQTGRRPSCFIQVNTGEEPQKAGVLPAQADALIAACVRDDALPVVGLMCLPPIDEEPSLHFALLRQIAKRNGLDGLSMGMTSDFEVAIAFGATHIRIGTAIFGHRPPAA